MTGSVRVGVIGTGFGRQVVAPAFEQAGCEVVEVVSARDDAAVAALCRRSDLDLVAVHSPPFMHLDHVRRATEGGRAVLCDKPFGRDRAEAAEMAGVAGAAGGLDLLNFEFRFDPLRQRLRELVHTGAVGTPRHVSITELSSLSVNPRRRYGWLFDADRGGGWLGASGSHTIDALRWIFGEIVSAAGQLRTDVEERPDGDGGTARCSADDGYSALMVTESGVSVTVDSSFAAPVTLPAAWRVLGTEAALEVSAGQRILRYCGDDPGEVVYERDQGSGIGSAMRRWAGTVAAAVRGESLPPDGPRFADGLACRVVMDRLRS